jgi:hypothetical protein
MSIGKRKVLPHDPLKKARANTIAVTNDVDSTYFDVEVSLGKERIQKQLQEHCKRKGSVQE